MKKEQLILAGFENITTVEKKVAEEQEFVNPRFPIFDKIVTIYGDESLFDEGLTWFDDGEDRFLFTLDVQPQYERMLLAKMEDLDVEYAFTKDNALIMEARYTANTELLQTSFFVLDFSQLNGVDEKDDWISLFWSDELDQKRINSLLVKKPSDIEELGEIVSNWWRLSPFEANR